MRLFRSREAAPTGGNGTCNVAAGVVTGRWIGGVMENVFSVCSLPQGHSGKHRDSAKGTSWE